MDALTYLLDRRWPPARLVAPALLASTLSVGLLSHGVAWLDGSVPSWGQNASLYFLWSLFKGALAMVGGALTLSLVFVVPLFAYHRAANQLLRWQRQRAVEDMLCAGLTGRQLVDRTMLYATRWWVVCSLPSLGLFLLSTDYGWIPCAVSLVTYFGVGAMFGFFSCYMVLGGGVAQGAFQLPFLSGVALLGLGPLVLLMSIEWRGDGVFLGSLLLSLLYVALMSRWLCIYVLENAERLGRLESRWWRQWSARFRSRRSTLPENAIEARQALRGADLATAAVRAVGLFLWLGAVALAAQFKDAWVLAVLLGFAVIANSFRAASMMSQVVTQEVESSTMETLRATPLTSRAFLLGWLRHVMRQLSTEMLVLWAASAPAAVLLSKGAFPLTSSHLLLAFLLSFVVPLVAALVGASIAGQAKPREHIGGQLLAGMAFVTLFGWPSLSLGAALASPEGAVLGVLAMTAIAVWVLMAGSEKSLHRWFRPQV